MQSQWLTMSKLLAPSIFRSREVVLAFLSHTLIQCYFFKTEAELLSWRNYVKLC